MLPLRTRSEAKQNLSYVTYNILTALPKAMLPLRGHEVKQSKIKLCNIQYINCVAEGNATA